MRVGLFTESYDPIINGVSTSVKTLATELTTAGHTPIIVAPHYAGFADENGTTVLRLPSWRTLLNPANPFAYPPLLGRAARSVIRVGLDVVHTQQPFGMGLHGQAAARRLEIPLVSTNHTLYSEYTHYAPFVPPGVARAFVAGAMRRYYNTCDAIVVPSRATKRVLEGLGVAASRLHVVPTGVGAAPVVLPAALAQARTLYDLPPGVPVLLFVGRIAREKNLGLLLEAVARLQIRPRPVLLLVGSGPYRDACRRRVRTLGLEPLVRFAGFLKRAHLAPVYAAATLFVFPSLTETQGVVLSEAQSHGLPCVVANGGGGPEFVRDQVDALVVPPHDPVAFARAIETLLADAPKRGAFRAEALSSPLRPTPRMMAQRLIAVYEQATQDRRRRTLNG